MRSENEHIRDLEDTAYRELRLLEEVDESPQLSQRGLAKRLGVALGVANLLLRNLSTKGYVRINRVGWRQWVYSLTPAGVARKVQLTLGYVDRFVGHYQGVRMMIRADLEAHRLNEDSHVAIYGTPDFAELVYLSLSDMEISEIEIFDNKLERSKFLGRPVKRLESLVSSDYAKVIVAASVEVEARCDELKAAGVPEDKIVTLMQSHQAKGA